MSAKYKNIKTGNIISPKGTAENLIKKSKRYEEVKETKEAKTKKAETD